MLLDRTQARHFGRRGARGSTSEAMVGVKLYKWFAPIPGAEPEDGSGQRPMFGAEAGEAEK